MILSMKIENRNLLVHLAGELDHHSSEKTRQKIDKYYFDNNLINMILDLRELSFMDSSGIGLIMGRYKNTLERKGKLVIVSNNDYIIRILKMAGLLKIVELYPTVESAKDKL